MAAAGAFLLMKYCVKLEWRTAEGQPFDWWGCIIYGCAMAALTFGASELAESPVLAWGLLASFALLLAVFCLLELKSRYPLLDIRLLARNRVFALSSLAALPTTAPFSACCFFSASICRWGAA